MKKLLLLICFTALTFSLQAQTSGGPDNYGYIWRDSNDPNGQAYNWIDIRTNPTTTLITGLGDDNAVGPFSLPEPFPYYWYHVSDFKIGSNGYLSFDNATFASPFPVIPTANGSNNMLAAMMSDLSFDNSGIAEDNPAKCYLWISQGQDSVIVTFDSVPFWSPTAPNYSGYNNFQIILDYNDSSIVYQYQAQSGFVGGGLTTSIMTIGIENVSGTDGLQHSHDVYPPINYAIKFYAPATTTAQITDASTLFNQNENTAAIFVSRSLTNTVGLSTQIKNEGNVAINPFNVNLKVLNGAGQNQINNNLTSDTLQPGQTQLLTSPNNFLPILAGTYRFVTTTFAAGDLVVSNNAKTLEMIVVDTTQNNIVLSYDDGTPNGAGISWNGGTGGCANHFIPPFYPCILTSVDAYILTDPNNVGYTMFIYKDDGVNGSAGTLIDSIPMLSGTYTPGMYITSYLPTPTQIDSNGFYVLWDMRGDGINLGTNITGPYCNRGYEVLGGTWSGYRNSETEDLMIRASIQRTGVGLTENNLEEHLGQFFPNPTESGASIHISNELLNDGTLVIQLFDIAGRTIEGKIYNNGNTLYLETSALSDGLYTVKFTSGKATSVRKLTVAH